MPFPFMSHRPLKSIAALALLILPALLAAQTSSSEEERLQKLMADATQFYVPKNHVTVGFRMLSSGGKVQYGNLGSVAANIPPVAPASDGAVTRTYSNGRVSLDALRLNETNADGTQSSTPGGRYSTTTTTTAEDGTTTTVTNGDFLSFTPGLTRSWSYSSDAQVTGNGLIGFSIFSATSNGGTAQNDSRGSSGVEFEFSRTIGNVSKRVEWGFAVGLALNDINNKTNGSVASTLHANTDFYSLNGQPAPAAPYAASSFIDFVGSDGIVYTAAQETTIPLDALPVAGASTSGAVGETTVNGNWQVKGAYFLMRFGPSLRAQLTERIGLSASLGVAGAYAGSTYSVVESFAVPGLNNINVTTPQTEQSSTTKYLSGYYANFNLELALNERTGLFGGVNAQKLTGYDQELGGRTAHIDLGSSVGIRGGISFKF